MAQRGPDTQRGTAGGRARRADIERAAAEVLAEFGYAAASIGRIADRAGVSKGVITHHFASRDDIMRRVALRLLQECRAHVEERVRDATTFADRLRATIAAQLEFFGPRRVRFVAMAEVVSNHRDEAFGHAFDDVAAEDVAAVATLIQEGIRGGEFRAVDAHAVAHLVTALMHGVLDRWAADDTLDLTALTATVLDFITRALAPSAPRE